MYKLKNKLHTIFALNGWKIFKVFIAMAIVAIIAMIYIPALMPNARALYWRVRLNTLNRQHFLYDFDYMVRVLEENFPYFDLVERTRGVDIRLLAEEARQLLADPNTYIPNAYVFYQFLREEFFMPIGGVGHLQLISAQGWYQDMMQMMLGSSWYYYGYWWYEVAQAYLRPQSVTFYRNFPDNNHPPARRGVMVGVEIIEEGHIGLISINHLLVTDTYSTTPPFRGRYATRVRAFLRYAADFEHMIIDIRGNPGGLPDFFIHSLAPYMTLVPMRITQYVFYTATPSNQRIVDATLTNRRAQRGLGVIDFSMVRESAWENMPQYLHDFDNVIYIMTTVFRRQNLTPAITPPHTWSYDGSFRGKIWMLTDEMTASAAEQVAWISYYTNFATIVGESTMGVPTAINISMSNRVSLPNTGIMFRYDFGYAVDSQGRYFEGRGVAPHYFNRPGLDALETVLEMIKERSYE